LEAALVQQLARCVDADGAEIIVDAGPDADLGVRRDGSADLLADRFRNALRRGSGVIDARALARSLDTDGDIRAQDVAPRKGPGALLKLRQMHRAECADARQNAACAADHEIGTPDIVPAALDPDASVKDFGRAESMNLCLRAEHGFQARRGGQEDL